MPGPISRATPQPTASTPATVTQPAAAERRAAPQLPRVPRQDVAEEVLPNGVTIIMNRRPRAAAMNIAIGTAGGAFQDPPGKEGAAHLVEHLAFEGTPRRTPTGINRTIQEQGNMGNAYTTMTEVVYETSVPARDARDAARMYVDMYRNPNADRYRVKKEQRIVEQEMRYSLGGLEEQAYTEMRRLLYGDTPHARYPIGTIDSVEAVTPADVRTWARTHHTGANTVVLLDGDPRHFPLAEIRSGLGRLPRGEHVEDPEFGGFRHGALATLIPHSGDAEATLTVALPNQSMLAGSSLGVYSEAAGRVLSRVLADRLTNRLRERDRYTYGVQAYHDDQHGEYLEIDTKLAPTDIRNGVRDLARVVTSLPDTITAEEVARARKELVSEFALDADDPAWLARQRFNAALEGVHGRDVQGIRSLMNEVTRVTPDDVRAASLLFANGLGQVRIVASGAVQGRFDDIQAGMRDAGVGTRLTRVPFERAEYRRMMDTPTGPLE